MAALASIRCHHSDLRGFYQRLRARGKAGKVAIVAVMRKLLLVLNLNSAVEITQHRIAAAPTS